MSVFQELKRRNVFRVALAYVIIAWLVMQVGDTMGPALHLPDWVDSLLAFFLILGFPIAMFLAWAFELTPEGLKRDHEVGGHDSSRAQTSQKLNRTIVVVMALALGYFALDKYVFTGNPQAEPATSRTVQATMELPTDTGITRNSIAVLPFVNMSSDPEQEYFSDGLTEELLNLLAGIKELKVAARTSSFYYKDKLDTVPLTEIARQLEVTHVLEGSVRKSGNTIRITAQLIKADDGFHLWSETYDRTLDDIFAVQDEIAAAVTASLKITLLGELPKAKVLDPESFELTLQARYFFNRRSEGDLQRALELFERAVELDPENVAAWVGMTPLYLWLFDPPDVARARSAVDAALKLEPDNPEAYVRLGLVLGNEGRIEEGWASIDRALELGPENALVLSVIAGQYMYLGDYDRGIEYQKRALATDPLHIINLGNMAAFLVEANRINEAEKYARKAIELAPQSPVGNGSLARVRLLQGFAEETLELTPTLGGKRTASGGGDQQRLLSSMAHYTLGNLQASDQDLQAFRVSSGDNYPIEMAYLHAWRGESDLAFEWIGRTFEQDPDASIQGFIHPFLSNLHEDPRWADVMGHWPDWER